MSPESATDQAIRLLRARGVVVRDDRGVLPLRAGYTYASAYPKRVGGLANVKWFVVHHTGSGAARPSTLETATFQVGPNAQDPFPGFAYWGEVEVSGVFAVAWDIDVETWSQGLGSPSIDPNGEGINNEYGLAIEFSGQDPTDTQWATVTAVHEVGAIVAGHPLLFTGHRLVDPNTTTCPGDIAAGRLETP